MLKKLGIALGLMLAVFVVVGLFLPTQYAVSRTIEIQADQKTIHHFVGDLKNWSLWTPWEENDPSVVISLGEKTSGIGASQSWTSNDGGGSVTLTMSSPDKGIKYDLLFGKDADKCEAEVMYSPVKEKMTKAKTTVTWAMQGDMTIPVVGGYFAAMMDSVVGQMFDQGLVKLKKVAEKAQS